MRAACDPSSPALEKSPQPVVLVNCTMDHNSYDRGPCISDAGTGTLSSSGSASSSAAAVADVVHASGIRTRCLYSQEKVKAIYMSSQVQGLIATMIFANFLSSAAKAQLLFQDGIPEDENSTGTKIFLALEIFFTSVFTVELAANLYSHWLCPFFVDPWNIFDLTIVAISIIALGVPKMPGVSVLRLFRAFRALRIFKRIGSLRIIVVGAFRCLPSVSYAFLVLALITGIWSIMAVEFFGNDIFCALLNEELDETVSCKDMFGQFSHAMLTMFQVTTYDSWSSGVTRPMLLASESALEQLIIGIFFVTYQFLTAIVLTNVVVSILLDKFLAASDELQKGDIKDECPDVDTVHSLTTADSVKARLLAALSEIQEVLDKVEGSQVTMNERCEIPKEERCREDEIASLKMQMLGTQKGVSCLKDVDVKSDKLALIIPDMDFAAYLPQVVHLQRLTRGFLARRRCARLRANPGAKVPEGFVSQQESAQGQQRTGSQQEACPGPPSSTADPRLDSTIAQAPDVSARNSNETAAGPLTTLQRRARALYMQHRTQALVAALIFINFFVSVIKAELNPLNDWQEDVFKVLEALFGFIFLMELLLNMTGTWFWAFWSDPWNIFDFFVVIVSILAVFFPSMPGVSVLRLFRAFRAFRLFKRIEQLRRIVFGAIQSLPRVSYAFVILVLIMGIWSIMAVEFFGLNAPAYFGNFFLSMLSMFQVMTFDSWSSQIARPIIVDKSVKMHGVPAAIFFICYVFVASIIMVNVVIAIFVDQFLNNEPSEDDSKAEDTNAFDASSVSKNFTDLEYDIMVELCRLRDKAAFLLAIERQDGEADLDLTFIKDLRQRVKEKDEAQEAVRKNLASGSSADDPPH